MPATLRRYDGTVHGFRTLLGAPPRGQTALREAAALVVEGLEAAAREELAAT